MDEKKFDMMITNFAIFESTYVTHQNGGRAFAVNYDEESGFVDVMKNKYGRYSKVKKVWTGDKQDDNSSVLVEFPHKKYMFIGTEIYEFETDEFITNYYSRIGNSDVPYPVALSEKYVYFMLEKKHVNRKEFPKNTDWADCYRFYYDNKDNLSIKGFKNLKNIEENISERIRWPFKNKTINPNDPYGEEYWENPDDIYCDYCHGVIHPKENLFILFGKPVHANVNCLMEFNRKTKQYISNVESTPYNTAKKLLKRWGYFDKVQENKKEDIDPYNEEDWNTEHKHIWEDKVERDPRGLCPPIDYRECKICGKKYRTHVGYGK
jgi:hypothetical protein